MMAIDRTESVKAFMETCTRVPKINCPVAVLWKVYSGNAGPGKVRHKCKMAEFSNALIGLQLYDVRHVGQHLIVRDVSPPRGQQLAKATQAAIANRIKNETEDDEPPEPTYA